MRKKNPANIAFLEQTLWHRAKKQYEHDKEIARKTKAKKPRRRR